MDDLFSVRCFLLDMDGTFNLEDQLLNGALRFIDVIKEQGKDFIFLTNNSSKNRFEYAKKITKLGLPISEEKVFTSAEATAIFLHRNYPQASLFVVGTPSLENEFRSFGLMIDHEHPQIAVLGFDTTMTYEKMWRLCDLVRAGIPYIATHGDFNCPMRNGFMPDAGAMIAFVKASTGREPDYVIGKPNRFIVDSAAEKLGLPISQMAMVGDRLYTDIALGSTSGILTVLVLSGETQMTDLATSSHQPNYIFPDLGALADRLEK
ncbi:MAG: HAD-IIA family hydrolase [Anaerolineales bacterium]|nr:HAD-IIA family hydrolase [Anaerolineales bacterium]